MGINAISNSPQPDLVLKSLKWPYYADSIGKIKWRVIDSATFIELQRSIVGYVGNTNFPPPNPNTFITASMQASSFQAGYPGTTYDFTFKCTDDIPNLGSLVLTFPI